MSLIPCNLSCKYQEDGYCRLESTAKITNAPDLKGGCAYFVELKQQPKKKSKQ